MQHLYAYSMVELIYSVFRKLQFTFLTIQNDCVCFLKEINSFIYDGSLILVYTGNPLKTYAIMTSIIAIICMAIQVNGVNIHRVRFGKISTILVKNN